MTETLLAFVPTHGLWLVTAVVALSCLALPLPASILVMTAGGFASAGDLLYWQVVLAAWGGFVVGDQVAYTLARRGGSVLLARVRRRASSAAVLDSAERLIGRFGVAAVFLSRTVLSPLGPSVSFLAGALRVERVSYTAAASFGALCWALAYSAVGYVFADRIAEIVPLIGDAIGLIVAASVVAGVGLWLARDWKKGAPRRADDGAALAAGDGESPLPVSGDER